MIKKHRVVQRRTNFDGVDGIPKLNIKQTVLVGLSFMSITGLWFFFNSAVPPILRQQFDLSGTQIGLVMGLNALFGLMLSPLVGLLSDRTRTRFGRRLPYILGGAIAGGVAFILMPFGIDTGQLWVFMIILVIAVFAVMFFRTPAVALMPDVTLKPHRTVGNGIINVMGVLGGLIGMILFMLINTDTRVGEDGTYTFTYMIMDNRVTIAFVLVGALIIMANLVLFITIRENKLVEKRERLQEELGLIEEESGLEKGSGLSKEQKVGLALLLGSVFLWFMAYNAIETWYTTYAFYVLDFDAAGAGFGMIFALAFGFMAFIPASILAVKIGRKRAVMLGILIMLAGIAIVPFITYEIRFLIYLPMALVGIGWATINASSFVMVVELSKNANLGRFVGIYYVASMSAQAITPFLSGLLSDIVENQTGSLETGLRAVFIYAGIFMALAFIVMIFAKYGNTYKLEDCVVEGSEEDTAFSEQGLESEQGIGISEQPFSEQHSAVSGQGLENDTTEISEQGLE
ncbi:MAG: MFS transporter [Firmicutes bacterium]|nr:MFS transporter [Bacillota bacterium]